MSDSVLYNLKVVLQKPLTDVECWNCTDSSTGTIPAGTIIEVQHAYDATHTTVCVENGPALTCVSPYYVSSCPSKPGLMGLRLNQKPDEPEPRFGFRFIIPNQMLREATGLPYPDKTRDLVAEIMAAEEGELSDDQMRETIKALRAEGMFGGLQGWWHRQAERLGV